MFFFIWVNVSFLTIRKQHRLRMFEKSVLGKIFEPKRGEETGDWGRQHNE